jgi:uncharacterized protein YecE (DUF72 family)
MPAGCRHHASDTCDGIVHAMDVMGCSGWTYEHGRKPVCPVSLPQRRGSSTTPAILDTVENNSVYRLPTERR